MQRRNSGLVPLPKAINETPAPIRPDPLDLHTARWLMERVSRVHENSDFKRALKVITDCRREGIDERDSAELVATFACLAVCQSRGRQRKTWEKVWSIGTGKTWKALGEFPARLRRMAKEVERIGASPIFAAATFTKEQTVERETARKRFHQLPGTMKLCAMVLDAFIQRVPELTRESFSRPERRQSTFLAYLSYVVKAATGKLLDRQVAELLDAAAAAFGVKREFYAMTIAQARSRFKKKPKT